MSTYLINLDMKKGVKKSHFSDAMQGMAKDEIEYYEDTKYKVIEVKSEEQNLSTNFQLLTFELLWNNLLRGLREVIK